MKIRRAANAFCGQRSCRTTRLQFPDTALNLLHYLHYPRIAALALSAAVVIASFADFAPETTSLTPIMKASWMGLDCGWNRIAFARSTSAFCRLISAASAACLPNALLNASLDQ